ncbi:hypothetical protein T10_8784 [Trichinella papuae]|uniref:Uncharacterized protein n=1 Tax=Trichinella papuae TaxID=268474 RepID=A0A0V1MPN9_9BILA|nr:hypothetical protein T10_8784 [Trichinella papuae]
MADAKCKAARNTARDGDSSGITRTDRTQSVSLCQSPIIFTAEMNRRQDLTKTMTEFADGLHYLAHKLSVNETTVWDNFIMGFRPPQLQLLFLIEELHVHDDESSAVMPGDQALTRNISQEA